MIFMQHMKTDAYILHAGNNSKQRRNGKQGIHKCYGNACHPEQCTYHTDHLKCRSDLAGPGRFDIYTAAKHENDHDTDKDNKIT